MPTSPTERQGSGVMTARMVFPTLFPRRSLRIMPSFPRLPLTLVASSSTIAWTLAWTSDTHAALALSAAAFSSSQESCIVPDIRAVRAVSGVCCSALSRPLTALV